jgi:hypothetical protein
MSLAVVRHETHTWIGELKELVTEKAGDQEAVG